MFTENSFWRRKLKYGTYARARGAVRHAGQISPTSQLTTAKALGLDVPPTLLAPCARPTAADVL